LDVALARFQHEQALRQELADTKTELGERNAEIKNRQVIDRAKALLMQRQGLTEPEAFAKLRKAAMNQSLKLAEVSQRMLDMADLLG
jgi:response regulator NasT